MEDITDAEYRHAKIWKVFAKKNLEEYHDLYVQSDTLFLADVFANFRNISPEIHELDHAKYILAPGLAWQAALKKTKVQLNLSTDIDMLLMVEKGIEEEYVTCYAKANNKYMKDYDKNKESSYFQYWYGNNLYDCAMSQKVPVNNFDWIKDTSQFNKDFRKNYDEESGEGYFLEFDDQYLEKLHEICNDWLFLPEIIKIENSQKKSS